MSTATAETETPGAIHEEPQEPTEPKTEEPSSESPENDSSALKGTVMWYNIEKKFGFVVLETTDSRIVRVEEHEIQAVDKKALHSGQQVELEETEDEKGMKIATNVRARGGGLIEFDETAEPAPSGPRYIILSPGSAPVPGPVAGGQNYPQPEINPETVLSGTVTKWNNKLCFGFIQPDGPYSHVFVHQSAIETEGYRGLKMGARVEFRVGTSDHSKGKATAIKVTAPEGKPLTYYPPHVYKKMMRQKRKASESGEDVVDEANKFDIVSEETQKGKVKWFSWKKGYGFIQPDGKEDDTENHIFVHMSQTHYMPPKEGSVVEYKLGKNKDGKFVALSVTGEDGGAIEYGTKRKRINANTPTGDSPNPDGENPTQSQTITSETETSTTNDVPDPSTTGDGQTLKTEASADSMIDETAPASTPKRGKKRKSSNKAETEHFKCETCDKEIVGQHQYDSHINGRAHKHKAEMVGMQTECKICNVVFSGRAHMESHIAGRRHQQAINPAAFPPQPKRRYYQFAYQPWRQAQPQAQRFGPPAVFSQMSHPMPPQGTPHGNPHGGNMF